MNPSRTYVAFLVAVNVYIMVVSAREIGAWLLGFISPQPDTNTPTTRSAS